MRGGAENPYHFGFALTKSDEFQQRSVEWPEVPGPWSVDAGLRDSEECQPVEQVMAWNLTANTRYRVAQGDFSPRALIKSHRSQ